MRPRRKQSQPTNLNNAEECLVHSKIEINKLPYEKIPPTLPPMVEHFLRESLNNLNKREEKLDL